jgi:lysophospholipase L1-like esterase
MTRSLQMSGFSRLPFGIRIPWFAGLATKAAAFVLLTCAAFCPAQENLIFQPIEDKPGLPRVLLIGDSISISYTLPVRKLLDGEANVHRVPMNGGTSGNGLFKLDEWIGDKHWDVIHFNFGLHDLKRMADGEPQVPIELYERYLRLIVKRLRTTGARLIWATTTPVPEGVEPGRRSADVAVYNAAARRVMDANNIAINDLNALAFPRLREIQRPRNVHFTPAGADVLAAQVAASIRKSLKKE